jgi:hypothetical protein
MDEVSMKTIPQGVNGVRTDSCGDNQSLSFAA